MNKKPTKIICGFPGIGKSTLFNDPKFSEKFTCIDSDSSTFDKRFFPKNYIKHIKENIGKYDYIFVSTHQEVLEELSRSGLIYIIVYPEINRKQEFLKSYEKRGNNQQFIEKLSNNWEDWISSIIDKESSCYTFQLMRNEFLSDAILFHIQGWDFLDNYAEEEIIVPEIPIKTRNSVIIAVDFDGTCVKDNFPEIGEEIGAAEVLFELFTAGHKIILNTMRCNKDGEYNLDAAVNWFLKNKIQLYGINENPDQKDWTTSPKVFSDYYIDDRNIGGFTIQEENGDVYVDWKRVRQFFIEKDLI